MFVQGVDPAAWPTLAALAGVVEGSNDDWLRCNAIQMMTVATLVSFGVFDIWPGSNPHTSTRMHCRCDRIVKGQLERFFGQPHINSFHELVDEVLHDEAYEPLKAIDFVVNLDNVQVEMALPLCRLRSIHGMNQAWVTHQNDIAFLLGNDGASTPRSRKATVILACVLALFGYVNRAEDRWVEIRELGNVLIPETVFPSLSQFRRNGQVADAANDGRRSGCHHVRQSACQACLNAVDEGHRLPPRCGFCFA